MSVFVLDRDHRPLMPCSEKRARLLLQRGRARIKRIVPFVIILLERMQNSEVRGIAYQRGSLYSYEVMEYLLERHQRTCAYCGATDAPFERDHVQPKARGGSDRISNLVLACRPCNQAKGALPLEVFLASKPAVYQRIRRQLKISLHDAAAVNATRAALFKAVAAIGLPVAAGSGAETKYNRLRFGIPKTHALDAACVGQLDAVTIHTSYTLQIRCQGRGRYQRAISDRFGFARGHRPKSKYCFGFQTGDLVRVYSRDYKTILSRVARIAVRSSGSFNYPLNQRYATANYKHCHRLQANDGYSYQHEVRYTIAETHPPLSCVRPTLPGSSPLSRTGSPP